jgi:hypothetical protein
MTLGAMNPYGDRDWEIPVLIHKIFVTNPLKAAPVQFQVSPVT